MDICHRVKVIRSSKNEEERLNPENGICLSPLYDRANDQGYISINENYEKLLSSVKNNGKITNKEYQELNDIAERTASRDLADLVSKTILINSGVKGAGAFNILSNLITP